MPAPGGAGISRSPRSSSPTRICICDGESEDLRRKAMLWWGTRLSFLKRFIFPRQLLTWQQVNNIFLNLIVELRILLANMMSQYPLKLIHILFLMLTRQNLWNRLRQKNDLSCCSPRFRASQAMVQPLVQPSPGIKWWSVSTVCLPQGPTVRS